MAFEETCYLTRLAGEIVRSIDMVSPDTPWRGIVTPGGNVYSHATAGAKAIMAFTRNDFVDPLLSGLLPSLTAQTLTIMGSVLQGYAHVRDQGCSTSVGEIDNVLRSTKSVSAVLAQQLNES